MYNLSVLNLTCDKLCQFCRWIPGRGVINWSEFGTALDDIQFKGARTFEITNGNDTVEQAAEDCRAVKQRWQEEGMS
jgi:sugar phosphate isomerase/epimerase